MKNCNLSLTTVYEKSRNVVLPIGENLLWKKMASDLDNLRIEAKYD